MQIDVPKSFLKKWVSVAKGLAKLPSDKRFEKVDTLQEKYGVNYIDTNRCFIGEAYQFKSNCWTTSCTDCWHLGFGVFNKVMDIDDFMEHRARIFLHFQKDHPEFLEKIK